jgi:hypothetical protein
MVRKRYKLEDHERAFNIFYESRTYQAVADAMQIDYTTVLRWAKAEYECPIPGCAFHNWDALVAEKDVAVTARLQLYEAGNFNPIAHDQAIRSAVAGVPLPPKPKTEAERQALITENRRQVIENLVRSDFERLAQWEMLWSKVMYQTTGQVLDFNVLVDMEGKPLSEEDLRKLLGRGVKVSTMEGAIRALAEIQNQIERLKDKIGIHKKLGTEEIGTGQDKQKDDDSPKLTIEDMRNFHQLLTNTPPEQRNLLVKLMRSENLAMQALNESGSSGVPETA